MVIPGQLRCVYKAHLSSSIGQPVIGRIQGTLIYKQPPNLLVDVQGVAYEIEAPMTTFYKLPDVSNEVTLLTHLVIRDDAHLLFGFITSADRTLFRALIKVNGVGAKMALVILSGMEAEHFTQCVFNGDADSLVRLPGVGKKTAERLIIEMRDRLQNMSMSDTSGEVASDTAAQPSQAQQQSNDAISALIALGYKQQEASRLVRSVVTDTMSSEEIIRQALKASVVR